MTIFNGSNGNDSILRGSLSSGVVSDPAGATGTDTGETNTIYGNGGNDTIEAGTSLDRFDSGDTIFGGTGKDTIYGANAYESLYGEAGDDVMYGGAESADFFDGGAGNDVIRAGNAPGNYIDGGTGGDRMYGGNSDDNYVVDNAGDKVFEKANGGDDYVSTSLATMKLAANVENLSFQDPFVETGVHFTGNELDNMIFTSRGDDIVRGGAGDDYIDVSMGSDTVFGGSGDDLLLAFEGTARLYGGTGSDRLLGGFDADMLYGGKGDDVFVFERVSDSTPTRRDVIGRDDGVAFEGAGKAQGDLIDLRGVDADLTKPDNEALVFGGAGKGHLSLVDSGSDTLVRGNLDDDSAFEFQILIRDGDVKASAYTAADFLLSWDIA